MTIRRSYHQLLPVASIALCISVLVSGCGKSKAQNYQLTRNSDSTLQTSALASGSAQHAVVSVTEKKKKLRRNRSTANVTIELQPSRVMCRAQIDVNKSNYEGCDNFNALALYRFSEQGTDLICNDGQTLRISPSAFSCHALTGYLVDASGEQIKYATRLGKQYPNAPGVTRIKRNATTRVVAAANPQHVDDKPAAPKKRRWFLPRFKRNKNKGSVVDTQSTAQADLVAPPPIEPTLPEVAGTGVASTQEPLGSDAPTQDTTEPRLQSTTESNTNDPGRGILNSPTSDSENTIADTAQDARTSKPSREDTAVTLPSPTHKGELLVNKPAPGTTDRRSTPTPKPFIFSKHLGQSTAFMVAPGILATNSHVIRNADAIWVYNHHKERVVQAQVLSQDADNDLALLSVDIQGDALPLATSQSLRKGNEIMAIGYPSIEHYGRETHSTFGHINALNGIDQQFFQFDAPIQRGNTGGPVLNKAGQVVGIVSNEIGNQVASAASFAIKSDYLLKLLNDTTHHPQIATAITNMPNPQLSRELADVIEAADPHIYIIMTSPVDQ